MVTLSFFICRHEKSIRGYPSWCVEMRRQAQPCPGGTDIHVHALLELITTRWWRWMYSNTFSLFHRGRAGTVVSTAASQPQGPRFKPGGGLPFYLPVWRLSLSPRVEPACLSLPVWSLSLSLPVWSLSLSLPMSIYFFYYYICRGHSVLSTQWLIRRWTVLM